MGQPPPSPSTNPVRRHAFIMLALMLCTLVMVSVSLLPLGSPGLKVVLVLGFAVMEAFLVAGHLMHLITERGLVFSVLLVTGIFFAGLLFLPILAQADHVSLFFK